MSNEKLYILWTSGDKELALNAAFMYAKNSMLKKWWQQVCLIAWGPSVRLLAENTDLQKELVALQQAGVEVCACLRCADNYNVAEKLKGFGVDVKYMGEPLTEILQNDEKIITF